MLKRFLGGHSWGVAALLPPWGDRPSIYRHLIEYTSTDGLSLTKDGETLPDDDVFWKGSQIRWVAGGLDGAIGGTADDAQVNPRSCRRPCASCSCSARRLRLLHGRAIIEQRQQLAKHHCGRAPHLV